VTRAAPTRVIATRVIDRQGAGQVSDGLTLASASGSYALAEHIAL
jgi:hypothetical protein